jgi:hypothetical protein
LTRDWAEFEEVSIVINSIEGAKKLFSEHSLFCPSLIGCIHLCPIYDVDNNNKFLDSGEYSMY